MPISNNINFNITRDDIITEALELLNILGEGETPNPDQLLSSSRTLNMMTKTWQADGLNLFAVERQYLFTVDNQEEYSLSSSTTDHFTADFVETTLSADSASGATTITVTSDAGILDGDNIGIAFNNTVQWTTVNGAPAANVITLTDTLDNDVTTGAIVYAYTTKANRPMKIVEGYVHIGTSNTDIPLGNISRRRYNRLSIKDTEGLVNQFYYDPQISAGNLFVWPTTDDEKNYLLLFVQRTLSDFDSAIDNPDYSQEWFLPLAYGLATLLAPKYGISAQQFSRISNISRYYYDIAKGFDEELYTSVYFAVDSRGEEL